MGWRWGGSKVVKTPRAGEGIDMDLFSLGGNV